MSDSRTRSRADRRRAKEEPPADKRPLAPDLKVVETQVFRGPNYWSYDPAIRLLVDLGALEDWPSNTIPGFVDGLIEMLPASPSTRARSAVAAGFGERLREGTWLGHVAEHIALELQRESGAHVYRGQDPERGRARALQRDLRVLGGAGRPGGGRARGPARSTTSSSRPRTSTSWPSSSA